MLQQQQFHQQNVERIDSEIDRYSSELKEINESLAASREESVSRQNNIAAIEQTIAASYTTLGIRKEAERRYGEERGSFRKAEKLLHGQRGSGGKDDGAGQGGLPFKFPEGKAEG